MEVLDLAHLTTPAGQVVALALEYRVRRVLPSMISWSPRVLPSMISWGHLPIPSSSQDPPRTIKKLPAQANISYRPGHEGLAVKWALPPPEYPENENALFSENKKRGDEKQRNNRNIAPLN